MSLDTFADDVPHQQRPVDGLLTLDEIVTFCLPKSMEHPQTTLRLFLLADYGPVRRRHAFSRCLCFACHTRVRELINHAPDRDLVLKYKKVVYDQILISASDQDVISALCERCREHVTCNVHLMSGRAGLSIASDQEIAVMGRVLETNDLASVYLCRNDLSYAERKAFLERIPKRLRSYPNLTRPELIALLNPLFSDGQAQVDFDRFSRFVHSHRAKTLRSMAEIDYLTQELIKEHQLKLSLRRPVCFNQVDRVGMAPSDDISQLLHRYCWQITDQRNRQVANINVRVLLDRAPDAFYKWDGNVRRKLNDTI